MITLYAADSPNVLKIFLALEEMALPYQAVPIDVMGGAQFDPAFRALSPNAKVPVIVDEDSPSSQSVTVFESGAILIYLADKAGSFLPRGEIARSEAIQRLMLQMSSIGPMFGQFMHFSAMRRRQRLRARALSNAGFPASRRPRNTLRAIEMDQRRGL